MQQLSLIGGCGNRLLKFNKVVYSREESEQYGKQQRCPKTEAIHLPFVWKGFEYTPRCFQHPVVVIHGTTHLADEPHSVRGNDAVTNNLILKRNQDGKQNALFTSAVTGDEKLRTDVIAIVQNEITVVDAET